MPLGIQNIKEFSISTLVNYNLKAYKEAIIFDKIENYEDIKGIVDSRK